MKRLRDPIYGYIDIDKNIVTDVIDSSQFQRLRQIIQTSYSPLYSSAVHNRFVHSLGVYHLGSIVAKSFEISLDKILKENDIQDTELNKQIINRYIEIFKLACLLHDVGHAPFSHTGEEFYLDSNCSRETFHNKIIELTNDNNLNEEIDSFGYSAAPHELMSVVVALNVFSEKFYNDDEKSFFARCILGYSYKNTNVFKSFLNCMISMLNSSIIDVDKLDYLIRDAYITGFDTVSIDYERLLTSIRIIYLNNNCKLVFNKSAISVIENVVFAHDSERKWIQNHPIVQYDSYLLKHGIEIINKKYHIMNYESLSVDGKEIGDGFKVSLLCDSDVMFLMKNVKDKLIDEYFARRNRRHPLWKSESEYKAYFNQVFNNDTYNHLENELEELSKYLNYTNNSLEINETAFENLNEDVIKNESLINETPENKEYINRQLAAKRKHLKFVECLKEFSEEQNIEFDFVIIKANQFNSGFTKIGFEDIEISFPGSNDLYKFKEITNTLSAKKSERDKFYYLFYRRNEQNINVDVKVLVKKLAKLAIDQVFD